MIFWFLIHDKEYLWHKNNVYVYMLLTPNNNHFLSLLLFIHVLSPISSQAPRGLDLQKKVKTHSKPTEYYHDSLEQYFEFISLLFNINLFRWDDIRTL